VSPLKHGAGLLGLGTFTPLLVSLLIVILTSPLYEHYPKSAAAIVMVVLVAGLGAVRQHLKLRLLLIALLVVVLAIRVRAVMEGPMHPAVVLLAHVSIAGYLAILAAFCITTALRDRHVTRDTVVGAICGYVLIAFVFAYLYIAIEEHQPGSFVFATSSAPRPGAGIGQGAGAFMYFSFVTITSVGYGDIVPLHPVARAIAMVQMVGGQLYLASFVARLVGVMAATRQE
jgi:hypothetical protein